jgi:hypothetical protein
MLGVNGRSDLSAVGDPNPVNQALYLVASRPSGKESCSNLQAGSTRLPGCYGIQLGTVAFFARQTHDFLLPELTSRA